jgi:hypothetical protein
MLKLLSFAALAGLIVVTTSPAGARGAGGNHGASAFSPGQQFRQSGSIAGYPGASGYAPGRLYRQSGSITGYPGASGYAPGRKYKSH